MAIRNPSYKTTIQQQVLETTITEEFDPTTLTLTSDGITSNDEFIIIKSGVAQRIKASKIPEYTGTGTGIGTGGSSDNYITGTSLILAHNGTSFYDASTNNFSLNNNGATFNSASEEISFTGGSCRITSPDNIKYYLGDSDYTIEAWINPSIIDANSRTLISQMRNVADNNNRQFAIHLYNPGIRMYWTTNGSGNNDAIRGLTFPCSLTVNQWQHIAICKSDKILRGFLNGNLLNSVSDNDTYFNSTADLVIGSFGLYADDGYSELSYIGKIKNKGLRLTLGIGRYTNNFSPVTAPFPIN